MTLLDEQFPDRHVCILGLGYVGLTLAVAMADVGFKILGVEIRDDVLEKLKKGEPHFYEPGLRDMLKRLVSKKRIEFVKRIPDNSRARVYIITVGTPLDAHGKIRLDMVENTSREVSKHLKKNDMVILRSTIKVGTTRKVIIPILKESGVDFDVAFCPERTLEGQALAELRQLPQIVGGSTFQAVVRAAQIFQFLTATVIRVNDLETAEIVKLIDNAYRDVTFAYANEVASICDALKISAIEVIQAGKLGYTRTNLPIPGLVGGPCLEKDPYILAENVREMGVEPVITMAARKLNERQPVDVIHFLAHSLKRLKKFPSNPVISLLGIAFKGRPATDDIRGTFVKPLLKALKTHFPKARYRGYDPVVPKPVIHSLGLSPSVSVKMALKGAHLALILNNHPTFSLMPIETLAIDMARPALIYDFWNSCPIRSLNLPTGVGFMALGSHGKAIWPER